MFKQALLFLLVFGFSFLCKAQSLSSRTVLNNLAPYWVFLEDLRQDIEKSTGNEYESTLEQSNNFIELELRDSAEQLFFRVIYKIQFPDELVRYRFYCADKEKSAKLEAQVDQMLGTFQWDSIPKHTFELSLKQIEYLQIADRIASVGNDIFAAPSDFGSVVITSSFIKLNQINRKNSRSIDHKDSYFLRDLHFILPLKENSIDKEGPQVVGSHFVGELQIIFNDGSAKSRKSTGDQIRTQIELEIEKHKQAPDSK